MRYLPAIVIVYMLTALSWWTMLLLKKNQEVADLKSMLAVPQNLINEELAKQRSMIIGEGVFFAIALLLGVYFIYKSLKKEIENTKTQNNFLLSISHELKSPLTAINLSLDTMKKRALNYQEVSDLSQVALGESKRLEKLIDSILFTAKLDHGYIAQKEEINISKLTQEVVNVYQTLHPEQEIIFKNSTGNESYIHFDRNGLQSVIINLLDNAIKYGDKKSVEVLLTEVHGKIELYVKDKGIGVQQSEKLKIFSKFYRVGDEKIRQFKGTGLGLYIVKKVLQSNGANISLLDNVPNGSIFKVTFP